MRGLAVADEVAEIEKLHGDRDDVQATANVAMASGLVAFANGSYDDARAFWHRAGTLATTMQMVTLPRAAHAGLWIGDVEAARADLAAVDAIGVHGPSVEADRSTIRAGIAAIEGRTGEALALYREAIRAWRDLGLAWDKALCGLDAALLLGANEPDARQIADSTREILVRLEATPLIERLDTALAGVQASRHRQIAPDGTLAEQEVTNAP